jgi:anti-sigma B factor antagonist
MDNFMVSELPQTRGLQLAGELDVASTERLKPPLDEAVKEGGPIFVDMRGLTFMDTTGVHAWLDVAQALGPKGWCLTLHAPTGSVRKLMEICGLDRVGNVHVIYHDFPDGQGRSAEVLPSA